MFKKHPVIIFLSLITIQLCAQDFSKIILNKSYNGKLDQVLDKISLDYGVKLDFDRVVFQEIDFDWYFYEKPFLEGIQEVCKQYKLKYEIDSSQVVHLYSKEALKNANVIKDTVPIFKGGSEKSNLTVNGKIFDTKTGESLPFVTVRVPGTNIGSMSNVDGFFTLLNVPTDTSTLVITYIGYQKRIIKLNPTLPLKDIQVGMQVQSRELSEVTIMADKQDLLQQAEKPGMIKMSTAKLDMLPNLGEKDIFRSFQLMPGVSSANESSSGLYVWGGTPDQALILYDGFTVYHVDHLFGFFSAFNAEAIKDVQLYRGGFESKFGGRVGSVVEITGKDGSSKKWNAGASVSLLGLNFFVEVPIKDKFTSLVTFRTSYQGFMYNLLYKKLDNQNTGSTSSNTGNSSSSAPPGSPFATQSQSPTGNFYDLNVKLAYKFGKHDANNITFSLFNSQDKINNGQNFNLSGFGGGSNSFSSNTTDLTKYGNLGGSIKFSRKFNEKLYNNTLISASHYFNDRNRSNSLTLEDSAGNSTSHSFGNFENNAVLDIALKSDFEIKLNSWNKLETGLLADYYSVHYSYAQSDTATLLSINNKGTTIATYLQDNLSFWKSRFNLLMGSRLTYYNVTNKPYFEPRASLSLLIAKGLKFQAATGLYYQYVDKITREDILDGNNDFWILSDGKQVPVSSSVHYIAGLNYEYKWFTFSFDGYYKNLYNISEYSLRIQNAIGAINYNEDFYKGSGIAKGTDYTIMAKVKGYNGWVTYALGKVDYNMAAFGGWYPASQDVRHEFKTVHTYRIWRFDISATWMFSTGQPYTAPQGGYQLTLLDGSTANFITVSSKNGERFPDYHRLDFAVTYNQPITWSGGNMAFTFSLFNVYNRTNIWYKEYQIENGKVVVTNVNYLGITPNFTFSFRIR